MNFGKETFSAKILNDDVIVSSMDELIPIAGRYV